MLQTSIRVHDFVTKKLNCLEKPRLGFFVRTIDADARALEFFKEAI